MRCSCLLTWDVEFAAGSPQSQLESKIQNINPLLMSSAVGTEGPGCGFGHLKKQHARGEAELEGEGGGVAEGGGRGHVVEDGAQGAGEGSGVGGVDDGVTSASSSFGGGAVVACMTRSAQTLTPAFQEKAAARPGRSQ